MFIVTDQSSPASTPAPWSPLTGSAVHSHPPQQQQLEVDPRRGFQNTGHTHVGLFHSTANQDDTGDRVLVVEEDVGECTLAFFLHPPPIPDWTRSFDLWRQQQWQWMVEQGYYGPVLVGITWVQVFNEWLQPRWPLLHNQGLRDPITDSTRWDRLFALSLKEQLESHIQSPIEPPPLPINPTALAYPSEVHPVPQEISSVTTTPDPRQSRRRIRNAISRFTAADIQRACIGGSQMLSGA
jgi:hypothetical protein